MRIDEIFSRGREWIQGDGNNDGYDETPKKKTMGMPKRGGPLWLLGILVIIFMVLQAGATWLTDLWWYNSLGFGSVFWTRIIPQVVLFSAAFVITFVFYFFNWRFAAASGAGVRPQNMIIGVAAVIFAVINGMSCRGQWPMVLRYLNKVPFETADPLFGTDVGFYVFSLPFLHFIQQWFFGVAFVAAVGSVTVYAITRAITIEDERPHVEVSARRHLAFLGAALIICWGAGQFLGRYNLLFSHTNILFGAGYTDVNVKLPAIYLNVAASLIASVLLVLNLVRPMWKMSVIVVSGILATSWLVGTVAPGIVQKYVVKPNEYELEQGYIKKHIDSTLKAYGLDSVEVLSVTPSSGTTAEDLESDTDTQHNIRLWDYGPLLRTYKQLQEIRSYYDFSDVDIDRYDFGKGDVQVMIAVREMDISQLQNPTWVNTHLEFTHGFGFVMNPVNEVAPGGMPVLWVKDLPPKASVPLKITEPRIYYGEKASSYALVKTEVKEFDYPQGDSNMRNTYDGKGGVSIGNFWSRLLFAIRFKDTEILFTGALRPESRVLFRRNMQEAVAEVAPFLIYDSDPYPVILDGRVVWVQDAYTVTQNYPYSQPFYSKDPSMGGFGGFNYMRNSVKVTMDAYDGTMTFYISDANDPLVRAWSGVFPSLFLPASQMPAGLREHLRYPEELFQVQSDIYRVFHMTNTNTFYNKEDVWEVSPSGKDRKVMPNYVNIRLMGQKEPEFTLIVPFMPVGRSNLIGWMAGRCDGPAYGKLVVYQYPKQELIFGPPQIEALIDQNPEISAQLSLWSQRGSDVIRGDLLVIPVGKSLLYVQPLYLKAERGEMPELKRVILSTGGRVTWAETFDEALAKLVGGGVAGKTDTAKQGAAATASKDTGAAPAADTAQRANKLFKDATEAQKQGNWARYGELIKELGGLLERMSGGN